MATAPQVEPPQDLQFLQGLTEPEFSELVLIPLLSAMGYYGIRYHHGPRELGKDILFYRHDAIEGNVPMCAVVKMHPLTGAVSSNRGLREVLFQLSQALKDPFLDPQNGKPIHVSRAYLVTPFNITAEALASVRSELASLESRVVPLDGALLLDHLRTYMPDLLVSIETPERRFVQSLLLRLSTSRTSRPLSPTKTASLLDVYTAGSLSAVNRETAALGSFATPLEIEESFDVDQALRKTPYMVVVGDVGAGKTSLLQMLALRILKRNQRDGHGLLPLLIPLHRLPKSAFRAEALPQSIKAYLSAEGLEPPSWRENNRFVLLLDGFDEIAHTSFDEQRTFDELTRSFPTIVVTSRPSRLPSVSPAFGFYQLRPFDPSDIQLFLEKWFSGQRETATAVADHIKADPILRLFCRTPLMLTLVAILAERLPLNQLPSRRTSIYSEIVDLLLGRWDELRGIENLYSSDLKAFVLEELALSLQTKRERRCGYNALGGTLKLALEFPAARGLAPDESAFSRELIYRTSLLRPSGPAEVEFAHLSFQEYFAARKISRQSSGPPSARLLYDDWWRGTWTFFFGLRRTLDILPLSRQSKAKRAVALAAYLAEADYTSMEKRRNVLWAIGSELLHQPNLDEAAVRHFSMYGVDLLEEMAKEGRGSGGASANIFNYVYMATTSEDRRALEQLRRGREVFRLEFDDVIFIMGILEKRLTYEDGRKLFEDCCERAARLGLTYGAGRRIEMLKQLVGVAVRLRLAKRAGEVTREASGVAQRAIYEAAQVITSRALPSFDEKRLSHFAGLVDI